MSRVGGTGADLSVPWRGRLGGNYGSSRPVERLRRTLFVGQRGGVVDRMSGPVGPGSPGVPIEMVLIEDDPGDVMLTREAFAEYKVGNRLVVLSNGIDAIAYLRGEGRHAGRRLPDLILLDLNMPGVSGRELLTMLRADPVLCRIPVVVLTASNAEEDVLRSQLLGADSYLRKPVDFASLVTVVRRIETFFLRVDRVTAGTG
jgi:CheY-like chemotaxis protein